MVPTTPMISDHVLVNGTSGGCGAGRDRRLLGLRFPQHEALAQGGVDPAKMPPGKHLIDDGDHRRVRAIEAIVEEAAGQEGNLHGAKVAGVGVAQMRQRNGAGLGVAGRSATS